MVTAALLFSLALSGGMAPEAEEKLNKPVTFEWDTVRLEEVLEEVSEQTGLSFVVPATVARSPEPVSLRVEGAPAGEVLEALTFAMRLEVHVTNSGVVALRYPEDDLRAEVMMERLLGLGRPRHERPPGPRMDEEELEERGREVAERVSDHPKVRGLLERLGGARLVPVHFRPEKRVWILAVRREGEEAPLAHVVANAEGEVLNIEIERRGRLKDKRRFKGKERPEREMPEAEEPGEREDF